MRLPESVIEPLELGNHQLITSIGPESWQVNGGQGVKVAVLDTGWSDHSNLSFALKEDGHQDLEGHGTHIAGIIGGRGAQILGVAPACELAGIKALPGNWETLTDALYKAINWGADVVNMSCGTYSAPTPHFKTALKIANRAGVLVVASAGNMRLAGKNTITYPARCPLVIPVAAIGPDMTDAPFSASGIELERGYCAPGVKIASTWVNQQFAKMTGTSVAAPRVSGLIALVIGKHLQKQGSTPIGQGRERVQQVIDHLDWACQHVGNHLKFGRGYIDGSKLGD